MLDLLIERRRAPLHTYKNRKENPLHVQTR
jgi:hypothetical protein